MTWLVPGLPMVAGVALWLVGGRAGRRALGTAVVAAIVATLAVAGWAAATEATATLRWGAGLELTLAAEGLSRVMAVLVPLIAAPVAVYAAYHEPEHGLARLVGMLTAFVGAMELLVLASDLLTLLVGWELVGLLSWGMIGFEWRQRDAMAAAGHAFLPTRFGDLGLFLAAGAAFSATGSLHFDALARLDGADLDVVAAGVLVAAAAKSGQAPFSPWLFSAMAGPTPVSALLHSATMVAAGAYALARLQPVLSGAGWFGPTVIGVGLATAVAGGALALVQDQGKRVLAASTSAQYGLMFVAVGAGFPGAAGAHLVTQAFFKALLFLAIGIAIQAAGTGDIRHMRLGRTLPVTAALAMVGSLALAAVPPLGGAWSKDAIVAAAAEESAVLVVAVAVAGLLSAAYATRLQYLAFGRGDEGDAAAPPSQVELGALVFLAGGSVILAALWVPDSADRVAELTGGAVAEEALGLAAVGLVAVVAGFLLGRTLVRRPLPVPAVWADWFGIPVLTERLVIRPSLVVAGALAGFDGRVVDGGVRAAGWVGDRLSTLLARRDRVTVDAAVEAAGSAALRVAGRSGRADDRVVDRAVELLASGGMVLAARSRLADDRLVDGAVDGTAAGVGALGALARRVQTGMTHHYLLLVAGGMAVLVVLARFWR